MTDAEFADSFGIFFYTKAGNDTRPTRSERIGFKILWPKVFVLAIAFAPRDNWRNCSFFHTYKALVADWDAQVSKT